jgi:hypothetical protein
VHVKLRWKVCSQVCLHDMLFCIMSCDDFLRLRCLYTEVLLVNMRTMLYCECCSVSYNSSDFIVRCCFMVGICYCVCCTVSFNHNMTGEVLLVIVWMEMF